MPLASDVSHPKANAENPHWPCYDAVRYPRTTACRSRATAGGCIGNGGRNPASKLLPRPKKQGKIIPFLRILRAKDQKLAASLAIAATVAGCGIIEHQPYPYKTSTKNSALGAWELVQTRMNSKFMPLYQIKTVKPDNILFVGKKQACHVSPYQGKPTVSHMEAESAGGALTLAMGPIIPGEDTVTYRGATLKMRLESGPSFLLGGTILRRLPIANAHDAINYIGSALSVPHKEARHIMDSCILGAKS